jgi:hypothetical protein
MRGASGGPVHRHCHIAPLVPKLHAPVSGDDLVKPIASVGDRCDPPGFYEPSHLVETTRAQFEVSIVSEAKTGYSAVVTADEVPGWYVTGAVPWAPNEVIIFTQEAPPDSTN